ncbi:MAG: MurI3 [Parcubacteria group bacterium]|nr:MurI3 [Parcubacteria group bacterium]
MIGVFDSGSGGLSVVEVLRKKAPNADLLYFGDIANAPYGEKSAEELSALTKKGIEILEQNGATTLLSACNSVSNAVLAGAAHNLPYIEMSIPTASYLKQYAGKRFLLLATPATIESKLYTKAVDGAVDINPLGIPGLAGAIEFNASDEDIKNMLIEVLSTRAGEKYDGIILGCTHYPLVLRIIEPLVRAYFGTIEILNPAYPVADEVARTFDISGTGTMRFLVSKQSDAFEAKVRALFPDTPLTIEVLKM